MFRLHFLVVGLIMLSMFVAEFSLARPSTRFDERTQMCRFISQGSLDWASEPWGEGGQKFREVCKRCHTRDNNVGATFLHAESYTSRGWNSIFYKRRVQCARDGSWDELSAEQLQHVNDYLYRNGDWTYDPNDADSCG